MKILLNKQKKINSNSVENVVGIGIDNNIKQLNSEQVVDVINEYEQYIIEKDKCENYRIVFTISPLCSNVLHNNITEITYNEGANDCVVIPHITSSSLTISDGISLYGKGICDDGLDDYLSYKYGSSYSINNKLNTFLMIRDSSFSHDEIGPFEYHCGLDVFNNHLFRKLESTVIEKIKNGESEENFNTLLDYKRDNNGEKIKDKSLRYDSRVEETINSHVYSFDTVDGFMYAMKKNAREKNGWFGFINPQTIYVENNFPDAQKKTLNKFLNNKGGCEFIDFYPDRSLFSLIPKYNKHRKRYENNWDFCFTYPYSSYTNEIVEKTVSGVTYEGLKIYLLTNINESEPESGDRIYFRSDICHNLQRGNRVRIYVFINGEVIEHYHDVIIENIGDVNGSDMEHSFYILWDDIYALQDVLTTAKEIRFRKYENGCLCKYYFRVFKKIPNPETNNSKAYEAILNKVGFSKTIYGEDVAQVFSNDKINVNGLVDNLNRNVSEIYLTIVKNNQGYDKWYSSSPNYTSDTITYSHCFGKVTSGIDCTTDVYDYNIHRLHNLDLDDQNTIDFRRYIGGLRTKDVLIEDDPFSEPIKSLESDITINNETFLGDIVEFNPYLVRETVLEYVYHRFNTAQREYTENNEYKYLLFEEIVQDDYDIRYKSGSDSPESPLFKTKIENFINIDNINYVCNLNPEGYWYNPHYLIRLKEFGDDVKQGCHTKIGIDNDSISDIEGGIQFFTDKVYFIGKGDTLYFYNRLDNTKKEGIVTEVDATLKIISVQVDGIDKETFYKWVIYKPNILKPSYAYELNDGTGRYLWRNELSFGEISSDSELFDVTFTNNTLYLNRNINFVLRRQDPTGEYGLSMSNNDMVVDTFRSLTSEGKVYNYKAVEYVNNTKDMTC